jgi:hypothetical protein
MLTLSGAKEKLGKPAAGTQRPTLVVMSGAKHPSSCVAREAHDGEAIASPRGELSIIKQADLG